MEVKNGTWKKIILWNGNGMEENCHYGIWKNRLPFHSLPWLGLRFKAPVCDVVGGAQN